jgi:thiol-disulfide isomerase/thioredoxin
MKNLRGKISVVPMILAALIGSARADEQFPLLQAGSEVYSNVTVTSVSATDVYFIYAGGMANVKIKNLSPDLQKHFSFDPKKAKAEELKQADNNLKYHDRLLHEPAPKPTDATDERPATRTGIYGDVPEKYAASTITHAGDVSPLTGIHTIDGQDLDFHGKAVVIDLFATWCGPCKAEMPYVEKYLWQGFKDAGVIVVAVGRGHTPAEVAEFQKQNGLTFYFAADPKMEIFGKFATEYIPRCILIGRDGRIKCQTVGFSPEDFRKLIVGATVETGKSSPK